MLKPNSNWSLFKLIISVQMLTKLKRFFAYIMCILMGKRLAVFLNSFLFSAAAEVTNSDMYPYRKGNK